MVANPAPINKKKSPPQAILVSDWPILKNLFLKTAWPNKSNFGRKGLWWPSLLTDWEEITNLYRGPSIDASYQVSVHLAKRSKRRDPLTNMATTGNSCF
jgi:hypothetical protein